MTLVGKSVFTNRPYNLFLLAAVLLVVSSFLMLEQTLDIHLHNTYYVFPTAYLIWAIALILLLAWTIYKLINQFLLTKYLTWFHVVATLIVLLVLLFSNLWYSPPVPTNSTQPLYFTEVLKILFIAGQIGFLINFVGGLFRRR